MSGYQRRMMLAESYPSGNDMDNAKVIINSEDITCEIVHIFPSEAVGIEGVDFAVQVRLSSDIPTLSLSWHDCNFIYECIASLATYGVHENDRRDTCIF